jgi:hypothetical protein
MKRLWIAILLGACAAPPPDPPAGPPEPGARRRSPAPTPEPLNLPPFDREAVESRYPALRGLIVPADEADARRPDLTRALPNPKAWTESAAEVLQPRAEARLQVAGTELSVQIPGPEEPLELPPMVRSIGSGRTIEEATRALQKAGLPEPVVSFLRSRGSSDSNAWIFGPGERIEPGDLVRIVTQGRLQTVTAGASERPVEMMPRVLVAAAGRRLGDVRADLERALGAVPVRLQARAAGQSAHLPRRFHVLGAVNSLGRRDPKDGRQASYIAADARVAVGKAYGPRPDAAVNQVIVLRAPGGRLESAIVADLQADSERPWPPPKPRGFVDDGDIVVVPRTFDSGVAAEWEPIGRFAAGRIDRDGLIRELLALYD